MKKTILFIAILSVIILHGLVANAQDSKILVGGGLNYSTDLNNVGFAIDGAYRIDDKWEAAAGFAYYLKKDYVNWSMLDFDAHYVFANVDNISIYGLAGINVTFWKVKLPDDWGVMGVDTSVKGSEIGLNFGAGARMPLKDKWAVSGEVKFTAGQFNFLTIGVGVSYAL
jgi:opacity protein-like surface antigen